MVSDPLETLGNMVKAGSGRPRSWDEASTVAHSAFAEALSTIYENDPDADASIEADGRMVFLYMPGKAKRICLIVGVNASNDAVNLSYGAVIEIPPGSGMYGINESRIDQMLRFDEVTRGEVPEVVNFWAFRKGVFR